MEQKVTLRQQLEAFRKGIVLACDGREGDKGCYNFYDWFCKKTSLKSKAETLFPMVERWVKKQNINIDNTYVFFKNNCPVNGPLYDDFRICDIKEENVIFTVIPKCGHSGLAEVWGRQNDFEGPIIKGKNMNEIYKLLEGQN